MALGKEHEGLHITAMTDDFRISKTRDAASGDRKPQIPAIIQPISENSGPQVEKAPPDTADEAKKPTSEIGGPSGLEPTRFGDWERGGRCSDF